MEHGNSSLVELLTEFIHLWPKKPEVGRENDKKQILMYLSSLTSSTCSLNH